MAACTLDQLALQHMHNPAAMAVLAKAGRIMVGSICPECEGQNVSTNEDGSEIACGDCSEQFEVIPSVENILRDAGIID